MLSARSIEFAGRIPVLARCLRWCAASYRDGSIVTIKHGAAAGLRWKRSHRYVNGYWIGHYELSVQEALARLLNPGQTFYDVGANAGFFTLLAARLVGPLGRCVAFEPLPMNYHDLAGQLQLNGLDHCQAVMEAVSDVEGVTTFQIGPDSSTGGLSEKAGNLERDCIQVRVTTVDHAVTRFGRPHLIKLDVEGAEVKALSGARDTIKEFSPSWLIELHGRDCEAGVKGILGSAGYRFFDLSGSTLLLTDSLPNHVIAIPRL
jgi:FkbM family methyltransferase